MTINIHDLANHPDMFDEAFTKLELNEIALILDVINKQVDGSIFDPLETTILAIDVPFYEGYRFLSIADHATNPPLQRYVFQKNNTYDFTIIDWNYKTIYHLNETVPIGLNDKNVLEYVRFYFSYVKGRYGRFIVCESADHVQWKDEPNAEIRRSLNQMLAPLEIKEKKDNGSYVLKAFMMLKNELFSADVFVELNGQVTLSNYEILMNDVPVMDSVFSQ